MPPKSLVKSMQAYARSLDNALERIDDALAQMPEGGGATAPPRVIQQLEDAVASATAKFERMDTFRTWP